MTLENPKTQEHETTNSKVANSAAKQPRPQSARPSLLKKIRLTVGGKVADMFTW